MNNPNNPQDRCRYSAGTLRPSLFKIEHYRLTKNSVSCNVADSQTCGTLAIAHRASWEAAMPRRKTQKTKVRKNAQKFDVHAFLSRVGLGRTILQYPANSAIYSQGNPADAVFYIQSGRVKLTVMSTQGKEATVALLKEGDFVGEGCITSDQSLRTTSALAITDSSVLRIERKVMLEVLHREHAFSDLLVAFLVVRNSQIQADLVDQLFNSAEKRLARALLLLTRFGKENRLEPVLPRISHEGLAEIVGTNRARVTFFMNRFRKLGFIDYNGGLEVRSTLLDVVMHD
jgi:CRP/FNR family transcriptional regulator, cyclic AMP receptor protein